MENLTLKELKIICNGLGLPCSQIKSELIEQITDYICEQKLVEGKSSSSNLEPKSTRILILRKIKRCFTNPLLRISNIVPEAKNSMFSRLKYPTVLLAILLGVFGGMHSLTQLYLYYTSKAIPLKINLPRTLW